MRVRVRIAIACLKLHVSHCMTKNCRLEMMMVH